MSEATTRNMGNKGSFEQRVFARFDTIDAQLETLESRSYDTKPIWERALAAITETQLEVGEINTKVGMIETKIDAIETRLGTVEGDVASLRSDYHSLLESQRDFKVKIARRIDLVLETLVDTRENMRNSDARLSELESKLA
jgi:chromosome segregation ATPase